MKITINLLDKSEKNKVNQFGLIINSFAELDARLAEDPELIETHDIIIAKIEE